MGEAICLMADFLNAPDTAKEERKVNPISALRESVSFGRFVSESIDWERWSSFCHNRYLEEAEKSSAPGTVAQKKAYFEAHYKKIAAQKAAALLEQENAGANEDPESVSNTFNGTTDVNPLDSINNVPALGESNVDGGFEKVEAIERLEDGTSALINPNETNADELYDLGRTDVETESQVEVMEGGNNGKTSLQIGSSEILRDVINRTKPIDIEPRRTHQAEKPQSKETVVANRDISAPADKRSDVILTKSSVSYKSSNYLRPSSVKSASPIYSTKENKCNLSSEKYPRCSNDKKRATPKSLHMSINVSPYQTGKNTLLANKGPSNFETVCESKKVITSFEASRDLANAPKTPIRALRTPKGPKQASLTQQADNSRTRTRVLKAPSENKKVEIMRHSVSNETRACVLKAPLENKKVDIMRHSVSNETSVHLLKAPPENKKVDIMRHSVSNDCSSPSSTGVRIPKAQVISPPLNVRSSGRADKRKEYFVNFEEKLNAQRLQRQAEAKEKAENELRILRQSLGFKARPLPNFYKKGDDLQKN